VHQKASRSEMTSGEFASFLETVFHQLAHHRSRREGQRAALLTYLLRKEVLLGHAADRGGEVRAKLYEVGVARVDAVAKSSPLYQGFPSFWMTDCKAPAIGLSLT